MAQIETERLQTYRAYAKLGRFGHLAAVAGYNGDRVYLTWVTSGDKTCDACAALDGETRLAQDWDVHPPLHPNCACKLEVAARPPVDEGMDEMDFHFTGEDEETETPSDFWNADNLGGWVKSWFTGDPVDQAEAKIRRKVAHEQALAGEGSDSQAYLADVNRAGQKAADALAAAAEVVEAVGVPDPSDLLIGPVVYIFGKKFLSVAEARRTLQAMDDLPERRAAIRDMLKSFPVHTHHLASNTHHSEYTPEFKKIADFYDLDLDGAWNKVEIPHTGRHAEDYHKFVLEKMEEAQREAGADADKFLDLFGRFVREKVLDEPGMIRSEWYE